MKTRLLKMIGINQSAKPAACTAQDTPLIPPDLVAKLRAAAESVPSSACALALHVVNRAGFIRAIERGLVIDCLAERGPLGSTPAAVAFGHVWQAIERGAVHAGHPLLALDAWQELQALGAEGDALHALKLRHALVCLYSDKPGPTAPEQTATTEGLPALALRTHIATH